MAALKDVPGFDFDEPEEFEDEASHFGAPGEEGSSESSGQENEQDLQAPAEPVPNEDGVDSSLGEDAFSPDALPEPELPQALSAEPEEELADIGEIDPDLLDEEGRGKSEWLILRWWCPCGRLSLVALCSFFIIVLRRRPDNKKKAQAAISLRLFSFSF